MNNQDQTVRDIVDLILKREVGYAFAVGTIESMLSEVLVAFATPEQRQKYINEQINIQKKKLEEKA